MLNSTKLHLNLKITRCSRKAKTQTQKDIEGNDKPLDIKAKERRKNFKCNVLKSWGE